MSKKIVMSRQKSGRESKHSRVEDAPLHVVGCVSNHVEKSEDSRLSVFLQAQKEKFEDDYLEGVEDEAQDLKAESQRRIEEMLQKAKEDLSKRKEKWNEESTSSSMEVTLADNKAVNALKKLRKIEKLRNQNDHKGPCTTDKPNNTVNKEIVELQPQKRRENDEYFIGTMQSKNKGKRKNRPEILINLEDLEKPLFEATAQRKHVQATARPRSAPTQKAYEPAPPSSPPAITCWQQKSGSELFPDVPTRTLTIYGDERNEDEVLKLAIEESLKTHAAEKNRHIDLTEANRIERQRLKTNNNAGVMQFPMPEPIEDEPLKSFENVWNTGNLCLLEKNIHSKAGQVQDRAGNTTECEDWEMNLRLDKQEVRSKRVDSENNGKIVATRRMEKATEEHGTRGQNKNKNDRWKFASNAQESDINSGDVGQPGSKHKVAIDSNIHNDNLNQHVKDEFGEGILRPQENSKAYNRQQDSNWCGIKKHDQNRKDHISDSYGPRDRQIDWEQEKNQVEGCSDQNWRDSRSDSHRDRRESKIWNSVPKGSDSRRTREQFDWWNQKKSCSDVKSVSKDVRGKSQEENWDEVDFGHQNRNYTVIKPVHCNDEIWRTEDDNECTGEEGQGDNKGQGHEAISQNSDIWRTRKASCFEEEEITPIEHFVSKETEESGIHMFSDHGNGNKVQSDLDKDIDKTESSCDENHNDCNPEVPVEHFFNFEPVSVPGSLGSVAKETSTNVPDAHLHTMHQAHTPHMNFPTSAPHFRHAVDAFLPPTTSSHGLVPNISSMPSMMYPNTQPLSLNCAHQVPNTQPLSLNAAHQVPTSAFQSNPIGAAHQVPNAAFQSNPVGACSSHPSQPANIQQLYEAFVQEQQKHLMNMNLLAQMAVMHSTGSPIPQPDPNLQAQQRMPMSAISALFNPFIAHPASYSDLLLQSNGLINPSSAPLLNPSLPEMNQMVAPSNVPLQSPVSQPLMRMDGGMQMPTLNSNMNMYSADSTALMAMLNHGSQANNLLLMSSQNYQSSQTQQPAVGNVQSMPQQMTAPPGMYSQPFGVGPINVSTSRVIGKGRGRINL